LNLPFCSINSVTICNRSCNLPNVAVIDINKNLNTDTFRIDGILGSDFIKNFVITIDYNDKKLIFENNSSLKKKKSNATKVKINGFLGSVPYIEVNKSIDDTSVTRYIIDTGIIFNVIPKREIKKYGQNLEMTPYCLKSPFYLKSCEKTLIDFGIKENLTIENLEVLTYKNEIGLIGCNYLQHFNITFDYRNKCMYFEKY